MPSKKLRLLISQYSLSAILTSNPTDIDYPIPANDDAIKSVKLILDYFVAAIKDGKAKVRKELKTK